MTNFPSTASPTITKKKVVVTFHSFPPKKKSFHPVVDRVFSFHPKLTVIHETHR